MCKKYSDEELEELLKNIFKYCDDKGYIPKLQELINEQLLPYHYENVDKYVLQHYNCSNVENFLRSKGLYKYDDLCIDGTYKQSKSLNLDDLIFLIKDFKKRNEKFPRSQDYKIVNNLPNLRLMEKLLKKNNMTKTELNTLVGDDLIVPNDFTYEYWLELLKKYSKEKGEPLRYDDLSKYKLPSSRWFLLNCKNTKVQDYNSFIEYELKMNPRYNMSKEQVIDIILKKQKQLKRPLMKKDFTSVADGDVCISIIVKYWGSFNKMKKSLGLEIVQEDMTSKYKNLDEIKNDVSKICDYVLKTENRYTITQDDWRLLNDVACYSVCCKRFIENNMKIRDYIKSIGFDYAKSGCGLNHTFKDGEVTKSKHELNFTNYLRNNLNLKYNKDYFREVRYNTFIQSYTGLMDCDYIIKYNDKTYYIEIAGILRDYKNNFLNDESIVSSKSKERYRIQLNKKKNLLEKENLNYFILFPCDLKEEYLNSLFK